MALTSPLMSCTLVRDTIGTLEAIRIDPTP
jgi:hypothetical protein